MQPDGDTRARMSAYRQTAGVAEIPLACLLQQKGISSCKVRYVNEQ